MVKVKRLRTADLRSVASGTHKGAKLVGSLLLGLYDEEGLLHHVGFHSGAFYRIRKGCSYSKAREAYALPRLHGGQAGGSQPLGHRAILGVAAPKTSPRRRGEDDHVTGAGFGTAPNFCAGALTEPRQCTFEQVSGDDESAVQRGSGQSLRSAVRSRDLPRVGARSHEEAVAHDGGAAW